MTECEKCKTINIDGSSRCENCGYLINIPVNRHKEVGLFERVQNSGLISEGDWSSFLLLLLIPFFNVYLVIRFGFFSKNESNIRNFCRALTGVVLGVILARFIIELFKIFTA